MWGVSWLSKFMYCSSFDLNWLDYLVNILIEVATTVCLCPQLFPPLHSVKSWLHILIFTPVKFNQMLHHLALPYICIQWLGYPIPCVLRLPQTLYFTAQSIDCELELAKISLCCQHPRCHIGYSFGLVSREQSLYRLAHTRMPCLVCSAQGPGGTHHRLFIWRLPAGHGRRPTEAASRHLSAGVRQARQETGVSHSEAPMPRSHQSEPRSG